MTFADALLAAADATLGWRETAPNDAPFVRAWLRAVGIETPAPWCVAAGYAWHQASAEALDVRNPHPRTAGSLRCWDMIPAGVRSRIPVRGAVAIFRSLTEPGRGHEAIVRKVLAGGKVVTIEGNTSADGGRNGDRVAEHVWDWQVGRRGSLELVGFGDLARLVGGASLVV